MKPDNPLLSDIQLSLGGLEPAQPTDRLFFAIFPDPGTAARITALARALLSEKYLRGKPLRPERLHVTLHHLGDYAGLPQDVVVSAKAAGNRVKCSVFDVAFDKVSSFSRQPRNRPFVLLSSADLQPLHALRWEIGECMAVFGLGRLVENAYTPHVTLLYDDKELKPQSIEPIRWTVSEFVLIHSLLGRTEHRVLGRWPLQSAP
ncbi:MAG: RNA 2',3'-cyclic phosphodiesterase [Gammaproteobacteria bacterium]